MKESPLPLHHNGSHQIVFRFNPTLKNIILLFTIFFAGIGSAVACRAWYIAVQDTTKKVPTIESRVDTLEILQVGIWEAQKTIIKKLDPENGEWRVQQLEAMMKVLNDQQEARRLEENGKKGKRGK